MVIRSISVIFMIMVTKMNKIIGKVLGKIVLIVFILWVVIASVVTNIFKKNMNQNITKMKAAIADIPICRECTAEVPYVLNTKGLLSKKVARAFIIPISNEVAMQKIKESLKCSGWEILKENKKTWYIRAKKDEYIVTANLTENSNRWILIIEKNDFITKYNL